MNSNISSSSVANAISNKRLEKELNMLLNDPGPGITIHIKDPEGFIYYHYYTIIIIINSYNNINQNNNNY